MISLNDDDGGDGNGGVVGFKIIRIDSVGGRVMISMLRMAIALYYRRITRMSDKDRGTIIPKEVIMVPKTGSMTDNISNFGISAYG